MNEIKGYGKIFSSLCSAQKQISAIGKNDRNNFQNFNFRGIDSVYNAIHWALSDNNIFSTSDVMDDFTEERESNKGGNLIYRILRMKYTFYAEDGSHVSTEVIGEAMDSGDKAANKAMAVAHKYALLQMFTVPTDGEQPDPDSESHAVVSKPVESKQPFSYSNGISEKQRKMSWAIAKKCWPGDDTKSKMENLCVDLGLPVSSKDMSKKQASELIEKLQHISEGGDVNEC